MTTVSGNIQDVTKQPTSATQIRITSNTTKTHNDTLITPETTTWPITQTGHTTFKAAPGRVECELVPLGIHFPLLVPDGVESVTLAAAFDGAVTAVDQPSAAQRLAQLAVQQAELSRTDASKVAEDRQATEAASQEAVAAQTRIESDLVPRVEELVAAGGQYRDNAQQSQIASKAAEAEAGRLATAAAESAAAAGESEKNAAESAQEATRQADRATSEADRATSEADRATSEADRATSEADRATSEADRAVQAAEASSVKAVTERVDRLLAGAPEAYDTLLEIAEELERGRTVEAALIKEISGKAPVDHTHAMSQVTGLQSALDGKAPASHTHTVADVSGLQSALDGKANTATVTQRPALFSGTGAPPASIPGAVVGDWWLDESTMELHKITGV